MSVSHSGVTLSGATHALGQLVPLRIGMGERLVGMLRPGVSPLYQRLEATFRYFSREMGIVIPSTTLEVDASLDEDYYVISLWGDPVGAGEVKWGRLLAVGEDAALAPLLGEAGCEPVYGMPGKWILPAQAQAAEELGCMVFEPPGLVATHLVMILQREVWRLLSLEAVLERLERLAVSQPRLVAEARKKLSPERLRGVLAQLLRERVSIVDLPCILETLLEKAARVKDVDLLTELARTGLGRHICREHLNPDGVLQAITLAQKAEDLLKAELKRHKGLDPIIGQRFLKALSLELEAAIQMGARPVLLVDFELRPHVAGLTERAFPDLGVLSWSELAPEVEVDTVSILGSRFHPSTRRIRSRTWTVKGYS